MSVSIKCEKYKLSEWVFKFLSFPNTEILKYKTKKLLKKGKSRERVGGKEESY